MTVLRRTVCRVAATAVLTTLTGCGWSFFRGDERTIRIAGGQEGGFYLKVATLLANEISSVEPSLRCTVVKTRGSVENVEMINSGQVDIGVSQADIAVTAVAGTKRLIGTLPIKGIGRMYEDYLQVVVLKDRGFTRIHDLAGRTVSMGAPGSGAAITGDRLISAVGIDVKQEFMSLGEAVEALEGRKVDALLWCGGMPTPKLNELDERVDIELLSLEGVLPALREQYGTTYQQVNLPVGGYGEPGMPAIGVPNLLLCNRSLPDDVVATITHVLVERAARLVPPDARGTQFLDRRALICLLGVPMHPGAASAYRQLHG
jgi:hypothetical protein